MTDRQHRFQIGQLVDLKPSYARAAAKGTYRIESLVPASTDQPQYRIKSTSENHVRVVPESDLTLVQEDSAAAPTADPAAADDAARDMSIGSAKALAKAERQRRR